MIKNNAAYDEVGEYEQDKINGLDNDLLDKFISLANIKGDELILDAMAGNGNLTQRIFNYCQKKEISLPTVKTLEYSKVQSEYAQQVLKEYPVDVIWGDILSMTDLSTNDEIADELFDIVFIKSANHEIPLAQQEIMYKNIYRVLKPGGVFINLGFLFECPTERDEFREIARTKDRLASMMEACENRHFLTQNEFYNNLRNVGFKTISTHEKFHYQIRSSEVARQYGKDGEVDAFNIEHQRAQISAFNMRKNGRICFEGSDSLMSCPGELTMASKPN